MKPYPVYKDSGVAWLGDVPDGWEVMPIKWIVETPVTDGPHETPTFLNEGIPFISAEAIKNNKIDFSRMRGYISIEDHQRYSKKYKPRRGDIYMVKAGATTGSVAMVNTDQEFNIWSPLAAIRADADKAIPRYVFYSMLSRNFFQAIETHWSFGTQQNIGMGIIQNIAIPVPTLGEQTAIVDYLERKTAQIDAVIAKKKRLIELLREERTAIISQAATKGLNPDAPMKESSVEWLGQVPDEWEVKRLKFAAKINPSRSEIKSLPGDLEVSFYPMELVGFGELYEGQKKNLEEVSSGFTYFRDDDVLIAKITPSFENGKGALASGLKNGIGFGTTELHVIRPSSNLDKNFLFYLTYSHGFRHPGTGLMDGTAGQKRVPNEFLIDYLVALPSLPEQKTIVEYLDTKTAEIDQMIAHNETQIERLHEYRTALISAVVTGKIDVRPEAAP